MCWKIDWGGVMNVVVVEVVSVADFCSASLLDGDC